MMTSKQYHFCVTEAANYKDMDAYVSDLALSSIWEDDNLPDSRRQALRSVYAATNRSVREIVSAAGMTQAAFAEHFCIPRRTVEDWCRSVRECPLYTRLMIQKCLGLLEV